MDPSKHHYDFFQHWQQVTSELAPACSHFVDPFTGHARPMIRDNIAPFLARSAFEQQRRANNLSIPWTMLQLGLPGRALRAENNKVHSLLWNKRMHEVALQRTKTLSSRL